MRIRRLCGWAALVMLYTGIACLTAGPSYACACAGESSGGMLAEWLYLGIGAMFICGILIVTLLIVIRAWRYGRS